MIPAPCFIFALVLALTLAGPVHAEPAAAIVIELPGRSVIASTPPSPPSAAELAAVEWGRDAVSAAQSAGASSIIVPTSKPQLDRFETIPLPAGLPIPAPAIAPAVALWKSSVVSRLEQNKKYPPEAASRREHGVAQVFFSIDRQGRLLESRVVRPSGVAVLDDEALALLKRAEPFPPPPQELAGDHVDLTVPTTSRHQPVQHLRLNQPVHCPPPTGRSRLTPA
jgi:TonB family protein